MGLQPTKADEKPARAARRQVPGPWPLAPGPRTLFFRGAVIHEFPKTVEHPDQMVI